MPRTEAARHIDEVLAQTSSPAAPSRPDDFIARSWLRCVTDHRLDPTRAQPARVIEDARLREHQEEAEAFMRVARGGMEQLFKRVSPLGYVLLLTDAQGVTVDYIGNDAWDRELKRSGLCLGADWNESHAGTCAVGTCIVEQTPLSCHRVDHFDATHIGLTCTAAPLFDPTGSFLGVLDISALSSPEGRDSQHLARHLTTMVAQTIEDANFVRHFSDQWILRLGADWALVDVSGECMLAFTDDGTIVGANSGARRTLAAAQGPDGRPGTVVGSSLTALFKASMADIWRVARAGTTSERSVLSTQRHELFYAMATPPRRGLRATGRADSVSPSGLEHTSDTRSVSGKQDPALDCPALDRLAGHDRQMGRLVDQARRLVNRRVNILLHGETGTGKEVIARALHESSNRAKRAFVAVNCASIPESLIESELFGYMPGSFTGGRSKGMRGLILQSDGGTLFLDEIGDMPLPLQTRLLRVLSEREVMPLGAETPVPVDLTVVAASHRDLRRLIADGIFREDLYYRLCGATLILPPLRTRTDKPFLIQRVLQQEAEQMGCQGCISNEAMALLLDFGWPGNIRQLRNVLRFALAVCDDGYIDVEHLPQEMDDAHGVPGYQGHGNGVGEEEAIGRGSDAEGPGAGELLAVLRRHHWNITAVSKELDICRATVYRQMKRFGIVLPTHQ